ncbi:tax1-binding protein 1 isoform X4 [Athene cunicularia]|uniref:tax1-binding protein 1 isoform X4 n=1 Tax=Athene cunicularia TaxID=194338 RepID=UPI000EF715B5|nr:tax1-binding protein 1 isoform X4 [Athene cunicularia]
MSSFQEVPSSANALQTSNFAHVIFQNVAKSYLPNTHLECHYTLTQFIHPHQKDWVGIFKVGWSTARDYYTFLWSPMPENYVEGSTVNCVLTFQGYYLPNDDGEFYQFCYVTHKGEIRGASTPFQFRTSSPVEELLTMEDEGNSDMLVVTTKAGLLEFKIEKIIKEKEELLKVTSVLEKETAQLRDQVERLEKELNHEKQRCDQLQTEQKEDASILKEQLRKAEDQIQASKQEAVLMSKELSDAVNVRDKTMADLHSARLENEKLKKQLADALAELKKVTTLKNEQEASNTVEQELRREVEDLKLRLQMAADHYKEKFKECQKLQKQVNKFTEQAKIAGHQQKLTDASNNETATAVVTDKKLSASPVSPISSDIVSEFMVKEQVREMNKEIAEKTEKYKKCKQMLADEKMKCSVYADELAKLELKWKEQVKINEGIKLQLAVMEDQYKVQLAEKERQIKELASQLELLTSEKELGRTPGNQAGRMMEGQISQQTLHFRNPYSEENGPVPTVPSRLPVLQYGNPYASQERRDGADGAFNPDDIQRPPVRTAFWELEDDVVCSQPSRNLSRPDGLEDPEDSNDDDNTVPSAPDPPSLLLHERGTGFCFDSSFDVHKKCPLCDVMFPPNYDQSKFEEHVESHWKVCPMCSKQFPPDYDQQGFERHVQTHFDQNVLNFD